MAKLSVIIPVYNVENYLRQCLDSVVNQTFKDLEIIIINDCSPDNSKSIIEEYINKDSRIKFIDNPQNYGYAKSVNSGIKAASGEYISIIESDDYIELNMYEDLLNLIEKNNCDVVKCNFWQFYGETDKNIGVPTVFSKIKNEVFNITQYPQVLQAHPSVWAAIYKRELLINNGVFFTESENGAYLDILFTFKVMMSAERILVTDVPYLHYRQDNSNSTINNPKKIYSISDEYDLLTQYIERHKDLKPYVNQYKLKKQYRDYKWNLTRISPEYKKEFLARFVHTFKTLSDDIDFEKDFPQKHKKELKMLLQTPSKYLKKYGYKKEPLIKKLIRININATGIYVELLGRQVVRMENIKK